VLMVVSRTEINGVPSRRDQAQMDALGLADEFAVACMTGTPPTSSGGARPRAQVCAPEPTTRVARTAVGRSGQVDC
jgi:hypothetical protein